MGMRLPFKLTIPTQMILTALLADPDREMYGLELVHATGLASGTVHPILHRLEDAGILRSRQEDINPSEAGRPARRYVHLAPGQADVVREALAARKPAPRGWKTLRPDVTAPAAS